MAVEEKDIIGQGMVFPLKIDAKGGVRPETGKSLIESSLSNIFATPDNTRYFLGQFHCRVHELLQEPTDAVTAALIKTFIHEAIEAWEPRIEPIATRIIIYDSKISIELDYKIVSTNQKQTFVYPFYNNLIY